MRLRYRSEHEVTRRDFDTYGIVHRGGHWYAVGYCHLRRALRAFRVDRVQAVKLQDEHFERPSGFDPLAHVTEAIARLPRRHAIEVLLKTDLATARRHFFPAVGVFAAQGDGVHLAVQAESLRWFARELARLPFDFRVLRPARLHRELEAVLRTFKRRIARSRKPRRARS